MLIPEYGEIPYGYALAYMRPGVGYYFYPLGVHLLVRWHHRFWAWMHTHAPTWADVEQARTEGRRDGWREALDMLAALADGERQKMGASSPVKRALSHRDRTDA